MTSVLEAVGVGELEERVYQALLGRPGVAAVEAARASGLSTNRVRRALEVLEGLGLVGRSPGSVPRFTPTAPDMAVEVLILGKQEELERTRVAARGLAERLRSAREDTRSFELVEVVHGKEAFAQRYLQLLRGASKEVLAFDKPPYVAGIRSCGDVELDRLRAGVQWRGIYDRQAMDLPGSLEAIERMIAAGEQARTTADLPLKLAIADRRLGLIPLNVEPGREEAVIVHSSPLLAALISLFETLWERAAPLRLPRMAQSDEAEYASPLATIDGRVLALLAAGFTDEAVGRQLGLGLSTVQRRVKRMMTELGARSRFQAGLLVAEGGLLQRREE